MGTWLYNAGQPCCGDVSECGVFCRSCIDDTHTTSPPIWSRTGTITDDNGVHTLQYSDVHDYWYTKYIVYETDYLGKTSEVWDGEGLKYKKTSGETIYRYIFRCNSTFDLTSEFNFYLTMLWAEGASYVSQDDADSQTNGMAVFLETSTVIKDNLIPLPSTFNDGVDGKGISSKAIWYDGCITPTFMDLSGPPTGDGISTSPGPISTSASVVIQQAVQYNCCGNWCNPCRAYLRQYGTATDENGSQSLRSGIGLGGFWGSNDTLAPTDYVLTDTPHLYQAGTVPYSYGFYCHPITSEYQLWLYFPLAAVCPNCGDPEGGVPDLTVGYGEGFPNFPVSIGVLASLTSASTCNPLELTFAFDDQSQYYTAGTSDGLSGPGQFTSGEYPWPGFFEIWNDPDDITISHEGYFLPFKPPLPVHNVTVNIDGYRPSGPVRCAGLATFPDTTFPIPIKPLTLSWKNSIIGDGITTMLYSDDLSSWTGQDCLMVHPTIPIGLLNSGDPAMLSFRLSYVGVTALQIGIFPQGDCDAVNHEVWTTTTSFSVNIQYPIGPLNPDNLINDYSVDPLYMKWTPDGSVDTTRQFLVDCGFTEFVVTS